MPAGCRSGSRQERETSIEKVRGRLQREVANYIPMLLALSVMALMQGIDVTRVLFVAGLNFAVGAIGASVWYSERRLTGLPLDRSVHDVLRDLLVRVDAASCAYEAAYVAVFACAMVVIGVTAWWQTGVGVWFTAAIVGGVVVVRWARRSGRAHVDRMFGPYRSELVDCLRELERL